MRANRLIPIATLAFAVACSDTATSPTSLTPAAGPLSALSAGNFGNVTTLNAAGAPNGGHIQTGSPVFCTVSVSLVVTCAGGGAYEVAGIGGSNATATLSGTFEATVHCTNNGGKLVPVKSQATGAIASTGSLSPKNGRLEVPQISSNTPTAAQFFAQATCPNGNWTKSLASGAPTLVSFTYTLTFVGFTPPAISITAS